MPTRALTTIGHHEHALWKIWIGTFLPRYLIGYNLFIFCLFVSGPLLLNGLEMSLALHHFVFILALMAFVAKGLPTTKQTGIERPILKKSLSPTMAAKWPTLAEVITNAGNGIKPSASLLDMLNSPPSSSTTTRPLLPATASPPVETESDIMDFGWNEDNIKLDFITGRMSGILLRK